MSWIELRRGFIGLGSSRVAIVYPNSLDAWFAGIVDKRDDGAVVDKWVDLVARPDAERYDVAASLGSGATGVVLGEALAVFWERVTTLLIDDLSDTLALHAAVLQRDGRTVLVAGQTGSGKTRLSLWLRTRGFSLASDEVVTVATDASAALAALPRPVVVKNETDAAKLLLPGETTRAESLSPFGLMMRLDTPVGPPVPATGGLIVFPRFSAGAALSMTALGPGETALRLMENCLNVRNLPDGGLATAGFLARRLDAVALDYGDSAQLDGVLDVLARLPLAGRAAPDVLAPLCMALGGRTATTAPAAPAASPTATPMRFARRLTVGMATFDDFDGAYFTLQSIRMGHRDLAGEMEFVIVDNNPGGPCSEALAQLAGAVDGCRYVPRGEWSGTAIKNAVFEEASSPFVLCVDSHVLVAPGALSQLIAWFDADPDSRDLLQGPMVYDDMRRLATHMNPAWRGGMFGTWAEDDRGLDPGAPAFDIPLQGTGLFACRRTAWPGFNPSFRGFGGEEGYIHEKVRQRGGRTLCLPFLRWMHRFGRPRGTAYVNRWEDRMRNYLIGFSELGMDIAAMEAHFAELLGATTAARIFAEIRRDLATT